MTQNLTKWQKRKREIQALKNIYFFGVNPLKVDGKRILHIDLDKPFKGAKSDS